MSAIDIFLWLVVTSVFMGIAARIHASRKRTLPPCGDRSCKPVHRALYHPGVEAKTPLDWDRVNHLERSLGLSETPKPDYLRVTPRVRMDRPGPGDRSSVYWEGFDDLLDDPMM